MQRRAYGPNAQSRNGRTNPPRNGYSETAVGSPQRCSARAELAAVGGERRRTISPKRSLSGERIGRFALGHQQRGGGVHGQQRCDNRDAHARLRHPPHRASRRDDRDAAAVRSAMLQQSIVQRCNCQGATHGDSAVQSDRRTALCAKLSVSAISDCLSYRHSKSHRSVGAPLRLRGAAACVERRMVASLQRMVC